MSKANRVFNTTLSLEENKIYRYTKQHGLEELPLSKLVYQGYTLDKLYAHMLKRKEEQKNTKLAFELFRKLEKIVGKKIEGDTLYKKVKGLLDVLPVFDINERYTFLELDSNNYVVDMAQGQGVLVKTEYIEDITNGCYQYKNGEIVLDEIKYEMEMM